MTMDGSIFSHTFIEYFIFNYNHPQKYVDAIKVNKKRFRTVSLFSNANFENSEALLRIHSLRLL